MYGCPKKALCGAATNGQEVRMLRHWSIVTLFSLKIGRSGGGGIQLPLVNGLFVPRNEGFVQVELRVAAFSSFTVFRVFGRKEELF